jgi:hypothetical protein
MDIPTTAPDRLAEHAAAICALSKRIITDVIEIGARLADCRRILKEDHSWRAWLGELRVSPQTAGRFIQVYELSGDVPNLEHLALPISTLYLLAAPSTPEAAREEIVKRAEGGERVPVAEVKQVIIEKGKTRRRRTSEEIHTANFKHGLYCMLVGLDLETVPRRDNFVPPRLSAEDADEAVEQIKRAERFLRVLADKIKQARSGPTPKAANPSTEVEPQLAGAQP